MSSSGSGNSADGSSTHNQSPFEIDLESQYTWALTPLAFEDDGGCLDSEYPPRACFSSRREFRYGTPIWAKLVGEYSSRSFTCIEDRVPAIAGLIEILQKSWNDTCVAGLWRSTLIQDLFWRPDPDFHMVRADDLSDADQNVKPGESGAKESPKLSWCRRFGSHKDARKWVWWEMANSEATRTEIHEMREKKAHVWKRREHPIAPSWSWLSIPGRVSFEEIVPTAVVVDCIVAPLDQHAPLLHVKHAALALRTKVLYAPSETSVVEELFDEDETDLPTRQVRLHVKLGLESQHGLIDEWCLDEGKGLTKSCMGLIVTHSGDSRTYQRLGVFRPYLKAPKEMPKNPNLNDIARGAPTHDTYTFDGIALEQKHLKRATQWENAEEITLTIIWPEEEGRADSRIILHAIFI